MPFKRLPLGLILLGSCLLCLRHSGLAPQTPRFDNTSGLSPPGTAQSPVIPRPVGAVTDSAGFDNFFLGVDFGEPHMSSNPLSPMQFFSAWNTHSTHYTQDGLEWSTQSPSFEGQVLADPLTAYDNAGNLYYAAMVAADSTGSGSKIIRSTDNGIHWSVPVRAIQGNDKPWLACDQSNGPYANHVYMTITAGVAGNFSRSTDYGATWTTTFTTPLERIPGMMVCVGANVIGGDVPGGCVYVVTGSGDSTAATYTFFRSTDGGVSFSLMSSQNFANYVGKYINGMHSVDSARTRPYPFIAADNSGGPHRGRLYLVYASNSPPGDGNKPFIFVRHSTDQGATWSGPQYVNDDGAQNLHWFPAIWCDVQTGRLYVKWYDSRNDPTGDSVDVYATFSDDGGASFAPNQRLTTKMFKINCSCGIGAPKYEGDYDAITSNRYVALAAWTDFRNNDFGSYTAYFPDFAMKVSPLSDSLQPADTTTMPVSVPAVKLYDLPVTFSASVAPPGSFDLTFAGGNSRPHVPDQLALTVKSTNAEVGAYTLTIQGSGPNGTPVHRRAIPLFVKPGRHSLATRVMSRWNLVSLPMTASDRSPKGVFPGSSSVAFGYNGTSYVVQDSFADGKGYWLRFPDSDAVTIYGIPRDKDTIDIAEGWNMIGSISLPIDVGTIGSIPGGIVASRFFGYDGRYSVADSIRPGRGYWVKANQSGKFILSSSGAIASSNRIRFSPTLDSPPAPPNGDAANRETRRPGRFTLEQNYPNPFNPRTSISYSIPRQSHVRLQVYNFLGELMDILVNEEKQPGTYSASWDASAAPSGIYFYRLTAGSFTAAKKMALVR